MRPIDKECPVCGQRMYLKIPDPWNPEQYVYNCSSCNRSEFYDGDRLIGIPSNEQQLSPADLIGAEIINVATDEEDLSEIRGLMVRTKAGSLAEVYITGPWGEEFLKAVVQDIREVDAE